MHRREGGSGTDGLSEAAFIVSFSICLTSCQNYNLIPLREAQTIERLTRTTILLAKVTILFLPIGLATSYFSMQLKDIESVPVQSYWFTFLAVVLVTIACLIVFELLSARYSGLLIYKGFARMALERFKKTQP